MYAYLLVDSGLDSRVHVDTDSRTGATFARCVQSLCSLDSDVVRVGGPTLPRYDYHGAREEVNRCETLILYRRTLNWQTETMVEDSNGGRIAGGTCIRPKVDR